MSVHTYTHSREERRSQQRPTFSPLPPAAEISAEGDLIPGVLKEGAPRRGEKIEGTQKNFGQRGWRKVGRDIRREKEIYSSMQKKKSLKPVKPSNGYMGETGDQGLGPLLRDGIPSVDRHR